MKCYRCNNTDINLMGYINGRYYCRKCILFGRIYIDELQVENKLVRVRKKTKMKLDYTLSNYQLDLSKKLIEYINTNNDVFVYASCGAGKTEIVLQLIEDSINNGKRICFAISRRQVVLEIRDRLAEIFTNLKVIAIAEGMTRDIKGDIIVCTMHQLYRFNKSFDIIINDEIDAFPYSGNEVLETISKNACKGNRVFLSATPNKYYFDKINNGDIKLLKLYKRYHGYPLIKSKLIVTPFLLIIQLINLLVYFKKNNSQCLIFVPTIKLSELFNDIFKYNFNVSCINSNTINKDEIINNMKNKTIQFIFCTTVLERGVTFENINVIVYKCDHIVFDYASLIQISGRVGRKANYPFGECYFLCNKKNKDITKCIEVIEEMNA